MNQKFLFDVNPYKPKRRLSAPVELHRYLSDKMSNGSTESCREIPNPKHRNKWKNLIELYGKAKVIELIDFCVDNFDYLSGQFRPKWYSLNVDVLWGYRSTIYGLMMEPEKRNDRVHDDDIYNSFI